MQDRKLFFNPTISFDGVAIIVAFVTCCVWFGSLQANVSQHKESIKRLTEITDTLSKSQQIQAANLAVLQTLVNERTAKNGK